MAIAIKAIIATMRLKPVNLSNISSKNLLKNVDIYNFLWNLFLRIFFISSPISNSIDKSLPDFRMSQIRKFLFLSNFWHSQNLFHSLIFSKWFSLFPYVKHIAKEKFPVKWINCRKENIYLHVSHHHFGNHFLLDVIMDLKNYPYGINSFVLLWCWQA